MAHWMNQKRDNLGRFTSGSYKREEARMQKDLASYVVKPGEPSNATSGLNPSQRRSMQKLDKKFFSNPTKRKRSRVKDIRSAKVLIRKYK